ncbi:MAG: nitrilase-related carbon-nitrogen hydrolase, partial [Paracoccaceae bacterium]
ADAARSAAQHVTSPVIRAAAELAIRHGIGLVLGYPELDDERLFNSAAVFDKKGRLVHNYRKVTLPNDFERSCFLTGTGPQVFEFEGVRCSVVICYDVEFPELPRQVALAGAELLIVPTALRACWRVVSECLVPTRAYENGIYVAYCDYSAVGVKPQFSGSSAICGPNGKSVSGHVDSHGLILGRIDTEAAGSHRSEFDFLEDLKKLNKATGLAGRGPDPI